MPSAYQVASLRKVMMATGASSSDVAAIVSKLKTNSVKDGFLLNIVTVLADSPRLFQPFIKEFKNSTFDGGTVDEEIEVTEDADIVTEETLTEDKLQSDIKSLKKIGWKLDKIIPFMVKKGDEYGVKITSDLVTMYFNDKGNDAKFVTGKDGKPVVIPGTNIKIVKDKPAKPVKKPKWPNNPPKSKINDPQHAEAYIGQVIASDESPDITGEEAYGILDRAGYTKQAIMWVIRNFGWDDAQFTRSAKRNGWITSSNKMTEAAMPQKPSAAKLNDPKHAADYMKKMIAAGGWPKANMPSRMSNQDVYDALKEVGYSKEAITKVINDFGYGETKFAKGPDRKGPMS